PLKAAQGFVRICVTANAAHITIDAISVRPVSLNRHDVEALLPNQAFGDLRAFAVELVRAVRRFTEQYEARFADSLQQWVVINSRAVEPMRKSPNQHLCRCVRHNRYPRIAALRRDARASRSRTSASLVCEKSSYQSPTA